VPTAICNLDGDTTFLYGRAVHEFPRTQIRSTAEWSGALRRRVALVVAVLLTVATGYATVALFAPGSARAAPTPLSTVGSWSVVATPNPSSLNASQLVSDSCVSATFCMAVGAVGTDSGESPLAARWDGTTWSSLPVPLPALTPPLTVKSVNQGDALLDAVSCTSTDFCMAVGSDDGTDQTLTEVWDGTAWSAVSSPTPSPTTVSPVLPVAPTPAGAIVPHGSPDKTDPLSAVSCTGPTFCVAVGETEGQAGDQALVEQWNGAGWSIVLSPTPAPPAPQVFEGVSCTSPAFCMAVGLTESVPSGDIAPLFEQWNGTSWSSPLNPSGNADDSQLLGVSCWGNSFCMADGYAKGSSGAQDVIDQWDGTSWSADPVATPAAAEGGGLAGLSCIGPSLCVATGVSLTQTGNGGPEGSPQIALWDGHTWGQASAPDPDPSTNESLLYSVSCVARQACMSVGFSADTASGDDTTLAERAALVSHGYYVASAAGGVFALGGIPFHGSVAALKLNRPVVSIATTPDGGGYWLVASDGGIFAFGDAHFYGSTGAISLRQPIVGMAATPDGRGYWLVAADGGVFCFGVAHYFGSTGSLSLRYPIVAMAATPDGGGYWLVASNGGVIPFGDAVLHGSTAGVTLAKPIVGMAATPDGGGYWLVAADGGVFNGGEAAFHGSAADVDLAAPMTGMAATPDGGGYWLVAADGGVFNGGDATFHGSAVGLSPDSPIVSITG
jgi:hypothetical protein